MKKRRLMLLRHAKSDWPEGVEDHERPLAQRGRKAAPRMGAYLRQEGLVPDRALVSSAKRTRETWELVEKELGSDVAEDFVAQIYEAPTDRLVEVVRSCSDRDRRLLLVGHNPGLADLAVALCDGSSPDAIARIRQKFPTAGLVVIDFEATSWKDVARGSGRLERFVSPRSLGQPFHGSR